jgi:hypothetical protein
MISRFLPLLLVAACARSIGPVGADPATDVALLAALFADARSIESQLADDFACAGIETAGTEEDAPPAVIAELERRLRTPVFPATQCTRDEQTGRVLAPGASGEGTWLTIGDIACSSAVRCTAKVSYYVANMAAGGRDVIAERTAGGWKITPTGVMWIS